MIFTINFATEGNRRVKYL